MSFILRNEPNNGLCQSMSVFMMHLCRLLVKVLIAVGSVQYLLHYLFLKLRTKMYIHVYSCQHLDNRKQDILVVSHYIVSLINKNHFCINAYSLIFSYFCYSRLTIDFLTLCFTASLVLPI